MRVALYARVSTDDKDQNPETQMLPLRDFVASQRWDAVGEWVDKAVSTDMRGRKAWRDLMDGASKRKFDLLLVWKIDRAFRSVFHGSTTLEQLRGWGVGFRSYSEPWIDTTTPFGEALFHITVAWAQLEKATIAERVKAGMHRASREGKTIGRPVVSTAVDLPFVRRMLEERASWRRIAAEHPRTVKTPAGGWKAPGLETIRQAWLASNNGGVVSGAPPA